jgi:hypothetical protein
MAEVARDRHLTAALELSSNQVTHLYSDKKNTAEMIRMMKLLVERNIATADACISLGMQLRGTFPKS